MSKLIPKAYKFRFYPQDDLKIILAKTFGCVRFVYNKTLDFSEKHYTYITITTMPQELRSMLAQEM